MLPKEMDNLRFKVISDAIQNGASLRSACVDERERGAFRRKKAELVGSPLSTRVIPIRGDEPSATWDELEVTILQVLKNACKMGEPWAVKAVIDVLKVKKWAVNNEKSNLEDYEVIAKKYLGGGNGRN